MALFFKKPKADVTLTVEGMHCGHCSARVQGALLGVSGVKSVTVQLDKKAALVTETAKGAADKSAMKAAVEALGFTVTAIK